MIPIKILTIPIPINIDRILRLTDPLMSVINQRTSEPPNDEPPHEPPTAEAMWYPPSGADWDLGVLAALASPHRSSGMLGWYQRIGGCAGGKPCNNRRKLTMYPRLN